MHLSLISSSLWFPSYFLSFVILSSCYICFPCLLSLCFFFFCPLHFYLSFSTLPYTPSAAKSISSLFLYGLLLQKCSFQLFNFHSSFPLFLSTLLSSSILPSLCLPIPSHLVSSPSSLSAPPLSCGPTPPAPLFSPSSLLFLSLQDQSRGR